MDEKRTVWWPLVLAGLVGLALGVGLCLAWHFASVRDLSDADLRARSAARAAIEANEDALNRVDELERDLLELIRGGGNEAREARSALRQLGDVFNRVDTFVSELIGDLTRTREALADLDRRADQ